MNKQEIVQRLMKLAPDNYLKKTIQGEVWDEACRTFAERLAEDAKVVTRQELPVQDCWKWGEHNSENRKETHTAILLDFQPIDNRVSKQELRGYINNPSAWPAFDQRLSDLIERVVKFGVRNE